MSMKSVSSFWQEHKDLLRGYIASRVREKDIVDDILQNVFMKAHTSQDTVKNKGSIKSWLFRITANAIADHYRSKRHWAEIPEELAAIEPERDNVAELANCLQPLIDELPEIYRLALILSEIEGLPHKEVADRLGVSLSGAKSRVQRGREKLRQKVLDCCDIEIGHGRIVGYKPRQTNNNCDCI